jgi:hypothetical protein
MTASTPTPFLCKTDLQRAAGVMTGPATHLDHLGVLCARLELPLIVTEEHACDLAREYYPGLSILFKEPGELTLDDLAKRYDLLLGSGRFWACDLLPLFQLLYHKRMRLAFCPHGNSDKGHTTPPDALQCPQDIALVYGEHMVDLLKRTGAYPAISQVIRTGNYRLPYYRTHHAFYDDLVQERLLSRLAPHRATILYAPTWPDRENPTSLFTAIRPLIEELTPDYNLIIKVHPLLEERYPAHLYHIEACYDQTPGLLFLRDFPPIYPLLARCAFYLGDYSSIGYDFLAFDRPLFFIHSGAHAPYLQRCGMRIPLEELPRVRTFLAVHATENQERYAAARRDAYRYAFGEEVEVESYRNALASAIRG